MGAQVAVVSKYYGAYYKKLSKKVQDSLAQANEVAEGTVSSIRTVRSFAYENGEAARYHEKLVIAYKTKLTQAYASQLCHSAACWSFSSRRVPLNPLEILY